MRAIMNLLNEMPLLSKKKSAPLAFVIGLVAGSIGLGIYFRSFIDFLAPLAIIVAITLAGYALDESNAYLFGAFLSGLYGAFRVANSNDRLARVTTAGEHTDRSRTTVPV